MKRRVHSLIAATLSTALPAWAAPPAIPAQLQDSNGIHLNSWNEADPDGTGPQAANPRLLDAVVTTAAIFQNGDHVPITVRILLPRDYITHPSRRYPVLYLLHGGSGGFEDWSRAAADGGQVQSIVDNEPNTPFDVIVVMPEGGRSGWYQDWHGATDGGFSPLWETFHVTQLVPWIDLNFRTLATRGGRSIAGLSMGGLGALKYAGRNPSVFSAVGSFSGATDLLFETAQDTISNSMWVYGATVGNTGLANPGYRVTFPGNGPEQEETLRMVNLFGTMIDGDWPDSNPMAMVDAYRDNDIKLGLYAGRKINGWDIRGEQDIADTNDAFHSRLNAHAVTHRYCSGYGEHSFDYWREDLRDFLYYVYDSTPATCTLNPGWVQKP